LVLSVDFAGFYEFYAVWVIILSSGR